MSIPGWYPTAALREQRREEEERLWEAIKLAEAERLRQHQRACKDPACTCKDPPPNWEGTEE